MGSSICPLLPQPQPLANKGVQLPYTGRVDDGGAAVHCSKPRQRRHARTTVRLCVLLLEPFNQRYTLPTPTGPARQAKPCHCPHSRMGRSRRPPTAPPLASHPDPKRTHTEEHTQSARGHQPCL